MPTPLQFDSRPRCIGPAVDHHGMRLFHFDGVSVREEEVHLRVGRSDLRGVDPDVRPQRGVIAIKVPPDRVSSDTSNIDLAIV